MSRSKILFASSPSNLTQAEQLAESTALIKGKLELELMNPLSTFDPRKEISLGDLAAMCRGLDLRFQRRAEFKLPDGEVLDLYAVFCQPLTADGHGEGTYLGNEVRMADGKVVAQRLRSPESAIGFKAAASNTERHSKENNLFIANWRDEGVIDRKTAKKLVVGEMPSDMTSGISYKLSWYARENATSTGRVNLRAALPAMCAAYDSMDAERAAKVAEAVRPEPAEILVSAEELEAITIAINTVDLDGGQGRLRAALKAAGVPVRVDDSGVAGEWKTKALAAAKRCHVAETVEA